MKNNLKQLQDGKTIEIRNEIPSDYRAVEEMTRTAFWNLYVPGGSEHYLVHIMRTHEDFVPELDFVMLLDGEIIGSVMYTKAKLVDEAGREKPILTFGPVCIAPQHQRMGYGKMLLEHSFAKALALGHDAIVIFGNPGNYVGRGFQSCKKHRVCLENSIYPTAMLVKELVPGALQGKQWVYHDSPVMQVDDAAAQRFDEGFPPLEKKVQPSQEEFFIHSHSTISDSFFVEE